MDECNRVTLPKPLPINEEALLELRRELHKKIYDEHRAAFTKIGEQISIMTEEELHGLRSLLKRIRAGEILIIKTDKSGKFVIVTVLRITNTLRKTKRLIAYRSLWGRGGKFGSN